MTGMAHSLTRTAITTGMEETMAAALAALSKQHETADEPTRAAITLQMAVLPAYFRWFAQQRELNASPAVIISSVNNAARNMLVSTAASLFDPAQAANIVLLALETQVKAAMECLSGEHPEAIISRPIHNVGRA